MSPVGIYLINVLQEISFESFQRMFDCKENYILHVIYNFQYDSSCYIPVSFLMYCNYDNIRSMTPLQIFYDIAHPAGK